MNEKSFNTPLPLTRTRVTDDFWHRTMELVRREVIPYQWDAINDRVPGAAPSWCMRNFRAAAKLMGDKRQKGAAFIPPSYTFRGFEALPEDPAHPEEDRFYGFVFQDTDFSKWIEAVGYSLAQHPDPELERIADEAIDIVCAAQTEEGYLDTYYILNGMDAALTNLRDHHELYCLGHLIEGAVAYHQGTGKDKLLRAACCFADYIADRFGPEEDKCHGYPGHEIAEMALIRLYEATGEERYLHLSRYFIDQRGQEPNYFIEEERARAAREGRTLRHPGTDPAYHQAHKPVREQDEAVGHAVRAVYLYSGMADAARGAKDEALYEACRRLWDNITQKKLYVTGGIGGTHVGEAFSYGYDLPGDTAYSETCAAIGLVFFARRMLQISPEARFADVMELALYNTVLAGMALDGKSFFYVNPLSVVPEACERDKRLQHVKPIRQKWFGCACCPPNIARLASSVAQYAWTESPDTLYTHLYLGGSVEKAFPGGALTLDIASGFPWDGRVTATVRAEKPVTGTLAFRIPGWTERESITAPGKERRDADGYVYLSGAWQEGETIELDFPMPVRVLSADPRVRETVGQVAVTRGPITFCAEEADNGPDLHLLRIDPARADEIAVTMENTFGHPTARLTVPGLKEILPEPGPLYRPAGSPEETPTSISLIPYYAWANRGLGEMRVWIRA